MLSSTRGAGLCSKCRRDLFVFFERGFCNPTPTRPIRAKRNLGKFRTQPTRRPLSHSSRFLYPHSSQALLKESGPERQGHAHHVRGPDDQLDAVEELERALGKTLEDAFEEDQLAATGPEWPDSENVESADTSLEIESTDDRIVAIRKSGAEAGDVAREARLIFGNSLPDGVLEESEISVYKRLYGEPAALMEEEDIEMEEDELEAADPEILDEIGGEVEYGDLEDARELGMRKARQMLESQMDETEEDPSLDVGLELSDNVQSRIQSVAESLGGEVLDLADQLEEDDPTSSEERVHPLTRLGRFGTNPSTVSMPRQQFVEPFQNLMSQYSNKHLREVCERTFGGAGLPDSPLTPQIGKTRQQVPVQLGAGQYAMSEMEANAFLAAVVPPAYAAIMSVLVETRKRLGPSWLTEVLAKEGGPRIFDAGAGGGGILAWNEIVKAHWRTLHSLDENAPPPPESKNVVLTGSDTLRHRSATLLDNTTFIPRLPNYTHTRDSPTLQDERPAQRKQFDIVIAPYTILAIKEDWEKKQYIQNLWSTVDPEGGVLILIEKGIPRGFEAVAGARDLLLERHIASPPSHSTYYSTQPEAEVDPLYEKQTGMIVAPCTNHTRCPLYKVRGVSQGRKDICSFQQRYLRPPQLQRVLGATDRNHDDVEFSYISVMKGRDLRQHDVSTFDHLVDPLSAPSTLDMTSSQAPTDAWLNECQDGFSTARPAASSSPNDTNPATSTEEAHSDALLESADECTRYPPLHLLPRLIFQPLKKRGHIILDLCTPLGTLERWTVPRSLSKQAFHDARKSQWGDLWGLGAKTCIPRNAKVGVSKKDVDILMKKMPGGGGGRGIGVGVTKDRGQGRNRDERLRNQAVKLLENMEEQKTADREEKMEDLAQEYNLSVHAVRDVVAESGNTQTNTRPSRTASSKGQPAITTSINASRPAQSAEPEYNPERDAALAEWSAEFESDIPNQYKKGGVFRTKSVGKASKAARRLQKEQRRKSVLSLRHRSSGSGTDAEA